MMPDHTINRDKETEILLEIALQIGNTHELDLMLSRSVSTMMRLLNCSGGQVLQAVIGADGHSLTWAAVLSIPRPLVRNLGHQAFLNAVGLPTDLEAWEVWRRTLPQLHDDGGKRRMLFDLPGFGLLAIKKNGAPLAHAFVRSLQPIMEKLGHAAVACVEIAEHKRAEAQLALERERLAGIIKGTNVGTWEWNISTGETVFNERWAEIIGYSLAELAPVSIETWTRFAHPDDLRLSGQKLQDHFAGLTDYYEFEARMQHRSGEWIWVFDRGRVIQWAADGKPMVMMGTHLDVTERKKAVDALQERSAYSAALLAAVPDLLFVLDRNGVFVDYKASGDDLLMEPSFFVGRAIRDVLPPPLYGKLQIALDMVFAGQKPKAFEYRLPIGSAERDFECRVVALGNDRVLALSRDMTERVTMERELRHHAEIEMLMANISMQFINIKPEDAEEAIQDALGKVGRTIGVDRVYVFEYAPDLSSSSNTYEWCADGIEPQIDNLQEVPSDILPWWQRHMLALKNVVIEEVMALPDEAVNERELLASQGILSLLVVPLSWGGQLGGFLGFDSVRRKKTWSNDDIAPLELLAGIVHNAVKHRAAQVELHELNESLERRVAERTREVESIQSQLYMTEKLASVGQLAAGVAHEINNPVSFVSTNFASLEENIRYLVDVLQAGDRLVAAVEHQSPDVMACAEEIKTLRQRYAIDFVLKDLPALFAESRDGIGRITSIVNSMRNFARQDVIDHVAPFDLNAGIRDTLVITRNSYKYHAAIDLDLGEIPMIQGVAGQINQVLLNLIVNAAQALAGHPVPDGGNGIIRISTGVIGDNVFCRVEDNGPGVPETNLSRIFDPFFTTKSPGDGTGLGLSISYDIVVNKHKGGLICRPSSLGGACFMMFLPTQREEPAE